MKIEIINKPMLCWDSDESGAKEYHVLAKVTECAHKYPYKVITNKNSPKWPGRGCLRGQAGISFLNAKPLQETVELTKVCNHNSAQLNRAVKVVKKKH